MLQKPFQSSFEFGDSFKQRRLDGGHSKQGNQPDHRTQFERGVVLHFGPHNNTPLKLRSMVGLIPLFAVTTIEPSLLERVPEFKARLEWFLEHRPDLAKLVSRWQEPGMGERRLLALVRGHRMKRVLHRMLEENEFLSRYGVRALSRIYADN